MPLPTSRSGSLERPSQTPVDRAGVDVADVGGQRAGVMVQRCVGPAATCWRWPRRGCSRSLCRSASCAMPGHAPGQLSECCCLASRCTCCLDQTTPADVDASAARRTKPRSHTVLESILSGSLQKRRVSPRRAHRDDAIIVGQRPEGWVVFYSERRGEYALRLHSNEAEACDDDLDGLWRDPSFRR